MSQDKPTLMQTYPVVFHDWQGIAIRAEGHWWIAPRQVSDYLGLKWKTQQAKISGSNLAKGTLIMGVPSAGGVQDTLVLKLGHFGHWLLSVNEGKVAPEKRARLIAMQESLLDAIERQLAQALGLPLMEAEAFEALPLPPQVLSQMEPDEVRAERLRVLAGPDTFAAARLARIGLPATRVAPLLNRSVYWARQQQRRNRRLGLVPLPPAQQRLLDQPSLFGDTDAADA